MTCKICSCDKNKVIYNSKIRNGGLGRYTEADIPIYQCENCKVIWHDNVLEDIDNFYESAEYRNSIEGSAAAEVFYKNHDMETFEKFQYTGTTIFRNKIVADIGCGCGAFLDYLKGVASSVIAIEPSEPYRKVMDNKGFITYPYTEDSFADYENKIDVITSFDVIEHVPDPLDFLISIYKALAPGGQAIVSTPTDAPFMRELVGEAYEKQVLFSTQHLWIFSEKSLMLLAEKAGFSDFKVKFFQRYGIKNLLGWAKDKKPHSEIQSALFTDTIDSVWKSQAVANGTGDYIALYLTK